MNNIIKWMLFGEKSKNDSLGDEVRLHAFGGMESKCEFNRFAGNRPENVQN